jgi:hypothetical protein
MSSLCDLSETVTSRNRRKGLSANSLDRRGHVDQAMNAKRKAVLERIASLEQAVGMPREYLESGKHAGWRGFRPLFVSKVKDGRELPPHKDWVKNVFLPRMEKALRRAEKIVERIG